MNATTALAARRSDSLTLRMVLDAWRGITREQIVTTMLLGFALHVYRIVVTIDIRVAPFILVADQLKAFALLLAIVVADRITGKDPDRRGVYALAVFLGAAIVVPLTVFVIWGLVKLFVDSTLRPPGGIGFALNIFFELLMVGGATIWVINDRRRAHRARTRMHAVQIQRILAERGSIESELQAMQARIEPRFLFNTLAQVKRLYAEDPATGEQLLDALIAYLHAAVPKLRGTSSTVGQELDLIRAYLAIARLRMDERLTFTIDTNGAGVANVRIPAMLLLPLVEHAISRVGAEWHTSSSIRVEATKMCDGIQVRIVQSGVNVTSGDDGREITVLRDRLAALYGSEARLVFSRLEAGRTEAVLEIPERPVPLPPVK